MKKLLIAALLSVSMASASNAMIGIYANAELGYIGVTGATTDAPANLFNGTVLMQMIWSASAGYSSVGTADGGGLDAGYELLWSGNVDVVDGLIPSGDIDGPATYGAYNPPGYVYVRVFDSAAPTVGDFYLNSQQIGPSLTQLTNTPPPTPDPLDIGQGMAAIDLGGYYINPLNIEIVPEPSVLAFLGLGGLALAVRRRFVA